MDKALLARILRIFSFAGLVFIVWFFLGGSSKDKTLAQSIAVYDGERMCNAEIGTAEQPLKAENKTKELYASCAGFLE